MYNYRNTRTTDVGTQKPSNIMEKYGPGIWYILHIQSLKMDNRTKQERFCEFMREILSELPCSVCIKHASEYINNNPPELHIMISQNDVIAQLAMFRYVNEFHNTVNKRLGKPNVSLTTAFEIYKTKVNNTKIPENPLIIRNTTISRTAPPGYEMQ